MKVIYTKNITHMPDIVYRYPDVFYGVIAKAVDVTVEGDYPNIVAAYQQIGVTVTVINGKQPPNDNKSEDLSKLTVDMLKKRLTEAGIEFDKSAKKDELVKLLEGV